MSKIGDNSKLTDEERRSLFIHHLKKRQAVEAKIKDLQAEKKDLGKEAQLDGFVIGDLDYALKALAAEDKKTITNTFLARGEILAWLNLTPGFQPDLFMDRAPAMEAIENKGFTAGLMAEQRVSGYAPKSDEDKVWTKGYDAGQKHQQKALKEAMDKRNAEAKAKKEIDEATPPVDEKETEDA